MKIKFLSVFALAVALLLGACGGKSDADLQKAATDKLKADNVAGVTVAVKDGIATLTGEVADAATKTKAEASAKVDGVKSVVNNITIKLPPPPPPSPDATLQSTINGSLSKAGCTGASAEIKDGVVTLRGNVAKGKMATCVQAAQESKPKQVINQLVEAK